MEGGAQLRGRVQQLSVGRAHFLDRPVAHEPGHRQGQAGQDLPVVDDDQAPAQIPYGPGRGHHGGVVRADDHQVVVVVGHGAGDGPLLQAEALDEAQAHGAAGLVPLDDRHLQDVPGRVRHRFPVHDAGLQDALLGDQLILQGADDPDASASGGDAEVHRIPLHVHRGPHLRGHGHLGGDETGQHPAFLGHQSAPSVDLPGLGRLQVVEDHQVRHSSRRDGAPVLEAEPLRAVQGGHADGRHRVNAEGDGLPHHVVDAALAQEIPRLAVVGAEADAPMVGWGDQRQQGVQVVGVGGLPDENVEAPGQLLPGLGDGGALVFAADARRGVGVELGAGEPGGVAIPGTAGEGLQLGQHARIPLHRAREVHHLGQAVHRALRQELGQLRRFQGGAVGLHVGGRHTGRGHDHHIQGQSSAALGHEADAGQAGDVGDLVGVRHHRGDAPGQHRVGEVGRDAEAALDVDVGVDQAWGHVSAGQVHLLPALVARPDAGDAILEDGDVRFFDLAGEDVDQASVAQDEIRGGVSSGHGE